MLSLHAYVFEFIESSIYGINIQNSMVAFQKETPFLQNNKFKGILPKHRLASLESHNRFILDI